VGPHRPFSDGSSDVDDHRLDGFGIEAVEAVVVDVG